MTQPSSLEDPPEGSTNRSERRWAIVSLALLAAVGAGAAWTAYRLSSHPVASLVTVRTPLPESVRREVLDLVEPHLADAQLLEFKEGKYTEFLLKGRSRDALAQDFYRAFRPLVVDRLMPVLRPYGESLAFDVASLDLPPVRLNDISTRKKE